ncbi:hypothetical protein JTE90_026417 [Oedothorax gibbosus]|uniref:EGF-like domain-containing protein n=1 Tax=Oedothorax gibbosus TaxID=931172 RepID=A0AAV6TJR5_9ARAC|nr:hypothetical protein JTE90_026417 [Oedothorax gibbosus]
MFTTTDPCMENFKERNCGKETDCKKINNETNNFQCTCAEGFRSYGYYQPFDDERTIIHKCEDVNECLLPKACPNRTRCINTYGSYACPCLSGFRPINESSDPKLSGCVEICNSKMCGHGKCEIKGDQYRCQCDTGYGGYSCDVEENLTAGPAGMKVALIVLSTLVVPLMLLSVYMVYKYQLLKKKSYRNNYLDDASSTITLQPMRGRGSRHQSQYN